MVNFSLEGKIALITGASYGIGFGIASAYAEAGATICFNDLSQEKVDKYKKIIDKKIERYGFCNTIIIRRIADEESVILLQNAFPTLEKYIDHVHTVNGVPLNIPTDLQNEIKSLFKNMIGLKKRGTNLFFTDIDSLKKKMLDEMNIMDN